MSKLKISALLGVLALIIAIPAVATAAEAPPHVFVGTAWQDGQIAPYGTEVTAWVGGEEMGSAMVLSDGRYEPLFVVQPGNGNVVTFTVGPHMAEQTVIWEKGGAHLLDLTANGLANPGVVPPPGP